MVENIETTQEDIKSWVISGQIPTTDVSWISSLLQLLPLLIYLPACCKKEKEEKLLLYTFEKLMICIYQIKTISWFYKWIIMWSLFTYLK